MAGCTLDAHRSVDYIPRHPRSLRASSGDVRSAERGRRRPQARLVTSSREAQSPSDPDEGSAFNGWTGLDERQRQCCPDNVRCEPPVQAKKHGDGVKNRRGGAPEGARAGCTARGRLRKGAPFDLRRSGAPPPSGEAKRNPGGSPEAETRKSGDPRA